MMIRSFLPVGQGAFYLEQFRLGNTKANIIYDCGSSTGIHIVEEEIRNNFEESEVIAAVFISHFDRDHINGLPYLLQYCCVSKLFFPLITEESRKLILLEDLISHTPSKPDFFTAFVTNPNNAFDMIKLENDKKPRIYPIREKNITVDNFDEKGIPSGEDVSEIVFDSCDSKKPEWIYVPFNFRENPRLELLKKALQDKFGKRYSCEELSELIKTYPERISDVKDVYRNIPGSFNTNSMTLLSASTHKLIVQVPYVLPYIRRGYDNFRCNPNCFGYANGCLYTGDFDASGRQKWEELRAAYNDYCSYIGCIQVPHHGSRHNYNHQLLTFRSCGYYVISAGEKNRYQHPHSVVIKDMLFNHKYPIIVTEYNSSTAHFIINDV